MFIGSFPTVPDPSRPPCLIVFQDFQGHESEIARKGIGTTGDNLVFAFFRGPNDCDDAGRRYRYGAETRNSSEKAWESVALRTTAWQESREQLEGRR